MIDSWNETLFEYYKQVGGNFTGDTGGSYAECRLSLEYGDKMILLEPVIKAVGNGRISMCGRAILSGQLDSPFTMTIKPYGIMNKAVELITKKGITIGHPDLDKQYLIRGSNPEYIKMALSGSRLAELLVPRRNIDISVKPVKENETLHLVQAVTKDPLNDPLLGEPCETTPEQFAELVELCYETWRAVTDYRIL